MSDLKIFLWAAIRHEDFQLCYITLPISLKFYRELRAESITWLVGLRVQKAIKIYCPYRVKRAYSLSRGLDDPYDDIPF